MTASAAGIYGNFGQSNYSAGKKNSIIKSFEIVLQALNIKSKYVKSKKISFYHQNSFCMYNQLSIKFISVLDA